jgi:hypothetical protein
VEWQAEIDEAQMKTIPRILAIHYKKIAPGLKTLFHNIMLIFKKINHFHITGKTEIEVEYIQMAYSIMTFRLKKHASDKIGKKIPKINKDSRKNKKKFVNNQEKELSIQDELRILDPQQSKLFDVIGTLECIYKLRHNYRVEKINNQIRDFVYDQALEEYRDNEREDNGLSNYMIEQLTLSVLALMKQIDARVFGEGSEQWTLDNIEEICRSHDFGDIMDSWIKNL